MQKILIIPFLLSALPIAAQVEVGDSIQDVTLHESTIKAKQHGLLKGSTFLTNTETITRAELQRAACCNLGESFVTNPSVDLNYSDAATGATQIRLLGLAGTYVQMLTESIPNFRGIAAPFGLDYVPGTWMQSIQVSKGAASVKNGYEAMTGQINVEFKKPQMPNPDYLFINGYGDMDGRLEGNLDATFRLKKRTTEGAGMENRTWGTTVFAHYDKQLMTHDANEDGFADMPKSEKAMLMNRWTYFSDSYISQWTAKGLLERRESGQIGHANSTPEAEGHIPYLINIDTKRLELSAKNAYTFNREHNSNVALMLSEDLHDHNAYYGQHHYIGRQNTFYASLMFETEFSKMHSLSLGTSLNYDAYDEQLGQFAWITDADGGKTGLNYDVTNITNDHNTHETVPGAYAQYTFNLYDVLLLMGGLRIDHSNYFGTFSTPRAHLKFTPNRNLTWRVSVGKGSRLTHALAENNNFLAGSRNLILEEDIFREESWNYGTSLTSKWLVGQHMMTLDLEYYFTDFQKQAVIDFDSDPHAIRIYQLCQLEGHPKSYSHVLQAQLTYPIITGFKITAAYRWNDVKTTYQVDNAALLLEKPLQSRWKGLFTVSYSDPLEHWQADATLALNGKARLPLGWSYSQKEGYSYASAATLATDGKTVYTQQYSPVFPSLNVQLTRNWRQWSVYAGGENLTDFHMKHPIVHAEHPWSTNFDPTMTWGPIDGAMFYVGFRYNIMR